MATLAVQFFIKSSSGYLTSKCCSPHVLRLSTRSIVGRHFQNGSRLGLSVAPSIHFNGRFCNAQRFSSSSKYCVQVISADNIVRSPYPDIVIPSKEPLHSLFFQKCDEYKNALAVEDFLTGQAYTFSQIKELSVKVAKSLYNQGFCKGDVVLGFAANRCEFNILWLACSCLGLWYTPANPALTPEELAIRLEHCDAKAIFTTPDLVDNIKKAMEQQGYTHKLEKFFVFGESEGYQPFQNLMETTDHSYLPDVDINPLEDVFALPFSSGTTGFPKGVMLTHYTCLANVLQSSSCLLAKRGDRAIGLLPLYHIYGLIFVQLIKMYLGLSMFLLPNFETETFLRCIQDKKINFVELVPPLIPFLTKHPLGSEYDLSSVEHVVCGGSALGAKITEEFRAKYPHIQSVNQGYGMTELSPTTHLDVASKAGSVGPLIPNTLAKIVDIESGQTLGVGQSGEVVIKGPQLMKGYYKNQEATDDMIKDGWLYTGDIAYFDKDGFFYVHDRLKELIKYKGFQVPPAELESLLLGHPEVQDVAVLGVPDEIAGELPKAFVVKIPDSSITEEELCKFVAEKVSPTKYLRGGVQFIPEVLRTGSGKILRRTMKQKYVN